MLLRKYIATQLNQYYAQPASTVVGGISSLEKASAAACSDTAIIPFRRLMGEFHWKWIYRKLYQNTPGQWLTPVELFAPYYSYILAQFIASHVIQQQQKTDRWLPLEIAELGGGRATNSLHILDHLQKFHPSIYQNTNYVIYDVSESLVNLQRQRIQTSRHADRIHCTQCDLLDIAEGRTSFMAAAEQETHSTVNTIVLGCEILDNLGHDKVRIQRLDKIEQAEVRINPPATTAAPTTNTSHTTPENNDNNNEQIITPIHTEVFKPLTDPLLMHVLESAPWYLRSSQQQQQVASSSGSNNSVFWIPTTACGLLWNLAQVRPDAVVVLADFDWLPRQMSEAIDRPTTIPGDGEPLVTNMEKIDLADYLQHPNTPKDILFPTQFTKLANYAMTVFGTSKVVRVSKQSEFLQTYNHDPRHHYDNNNNNNNDWIRQTTSWISGYSPLLHDFANCSVLTIANQ
jgi:hypothetical protein